MMDDRERTAAKTWGAQTDAQRKGRSPIMQKTHTKDRILSVRIGKLEPLFPAGFELFPELWNAFLFDPESGSGKINVTVQERFIEIGAVTKCDRKLATGESVRIVATDEMGLVVVEPLKK